jgi:polyferredoxin
MNFPREASKILTNKYFLYFMVFLASTNVLGYLVTNKINAVIFFALVSLLTYYFSKNYAVILLVALISTNFMMANKMMREGLEGQNTDGTTNTVLENVSSTDPQ